MGTIKVKPELSSFGIFCYEVMRWFCFFSFFFVFFVFFYHRTVRLVGKALGCRAGGRALASSWHQYLAGGNVARDF